MSRGTPSSPAAVLLILAVSSLAFSCVSSSVKAEEYYALGTAYFDLQKYAEAETWYKKALGHKKTRASAEYNLGRIAFELGRYEDAAHYFKRILSRDPQNITALKAAAYTSIKTGELERALEYYTKVLALVPESADEGYNYALVLMALGNPADAEAVLLKAGMPDGAEALLLLARAQKEQGKPEAADTYRACLSRSDRPDIHFEYAEALETGEYYARALAEYRLTLQKIDKAGAESDPAADAAPDDTGTYAVPAKALVLFRIARVILVSDPGNAGGLTAFSQALDEGYDDAEELDKLAARLSGAGRESFNKIRSEKGGGGSPPDGLPL